MNAPPNMLHRSAKEFGGKAGYEKAVKGLEDEIFFGVGRNDMIDNSFRHSAGFGKRMEYKIVGDMLMEGLDCYMPLVDDHGVDCVIKREDGVFIEVQIKARSKEVTDGDAALFAGITHELTTNFYFVFYSERLGKTWILSSEEFLKECVTNKTGKNVGKRGIWFNGNRKNKDTGEKEEYAFSKFDKYLANDYSRFHAPSIADTTENNGD